MPKTKISEYSATANSNTDVASINIDEGCAPSGINNAIRAVMGHLKDWQSGSQDVYTTPAGSVSAPAITTTGDTNTGVYFPAADKVAITTGGTQAVIVDASQNVGIGTSSGVAKLAAITTSGATAFATGSGNQNFYVSADTATRYVTLASSGDLSGGFIFKVGNTEASRIDLSGNLLVGDTTAGQTSGYGIKIAPAGDGANYPRISLVTAATTNGQSNGFSLYSVGAAAWRFYVGAGGTISATSTTITGISDQRLKENIRDLDDGLEKVMALQPRKFDWKEGKGQDIKNARGFIAQEFEEVFPDMIEEWLDPAPEGEEPYKAVNANLIPTLVKAIQEQQALITTLTERITALEQA